MTAGRLLALLCVCQLVSVACAPGATGARPEVPPGAPRPLPRPSVTGCVESEELRAYVQRLERHSRAARARALAARGLSEHAREVFVLERPRVLEQPGSVHPGQVVESEQGSALVVAELATARAPSASLVTQEGMIRLVVEQPQRIPVPLLVCGVQACPKPLASAPSTSAAPARRTFAVRLQASEAVGPPLELPYERYHVQPRYSEAEACQ